MHSEPVEILLDHTRAFSSPPKEGYLPALCAALYTLDISSRFLAKAFVGRGSIAAADKLLEGYWRRILKSGNASLRATGRHHFNPAQPYIVMSNHFSQLDIPILMGAIPGSMRMVMKEQLKWVPVWGPALLASGFVAIDRKNTQRAIGQLEKAKEQIRKGITVWVSPEGRRSRDCKLAPFKKGGFHLALDLGVPIIPAWIEGAADIIPPDSFLARYDGCATVHFGAPIQTNGGRKEDLPDLMAEVRKAILALSGRAEEVDGASVAQGYPALERSTA